MNDASTILTLVGLSFFGGLLLGYKLGRRL